MSSCLGHPRTLTRTVKPFGCNSFRRSKMTNQLLILTCVLALIVGIASQSSSCGIRRVKRVVGGSEALPHSWPWQVLLEMKRGPSFVQRCGGTLINARWLATAAHCVFGNPDPLLFRVKLGAHNRSKPETSTQVFGVDRIVMHRRFLTDKGYGYDLALIKLSRPAVLNFAVQLACLPRQGHRVAIGTECYLTGWGSTSYRSPKSITLQQTMLPVATHEDCKAGNSWFQPIDDVSMLCAGIGGNSQTSGCNGDSGGPLICEENGRWVLRGAISWGDPKCRAGSTYSVFTRISSFVDWITMHINAKPAPGLAPPGEQNSCSDNHDYCSTWKEKGLCKSPYYKISLGKYCPLTCGNCKLNIMARLFNHVTTGSRKDGRK